MKNISHLSFIKVAYTKKDFVLKIWNAYPILLIRLSYAHVFNTIGGIYP